VAKNQIVTNSPETLNLVTYLARVNVHSILQSTTLQYDASRGTFSTPLGIVTADAIEEARRLLTDIGAYVHSQDYSNPCFVAKLNDYLMLVPQNIGRGRPDPKVLYPNLESVQAQNGILDSLEASLQMALSTPKDQDAPPPPRLFEAKLNLVEIGREIDRIRAKYKATLQNRHACAHLDIRRVFAVEIAAMQKAFEETGRQIGNIQELWHGTKASNLLSILKSGFYIPPTNAPHVTGRLFGNGIYFSDQSTKSLNYAYGYWDGRREDNCFMFLNDVAMGKSYNPNRIGEALPKPGFDSTFAIGGTGSLLNNDMIVYHTRQINPRFLIEFSPNGR
jgi:poly [ADP-ribose] polymerase